MTTSATVDPGRQGPVVRKRLAHALRMAALLWLAGLAHIGAASAETGRVVISASQTALLVWIAKDWELFKQQGLDVEIRQFQSGLSSAEAMLGGKADLATSADAVLASKSHAHPDLRAIATISLSKTSRLVGRKDRGIRDASDLPGKKIGVTLKSYSEYFLTRYLALHGIPMTAPVLVNLQPAEIADGLARGNLDAGLTWEPFISEAENQLKDNALRLPDQIDNFYYFTLLSTQGWLRENPETAALVLRALIKAEEIASDYPDRAKEAIQNRFGYRKSYVEKMWPLHKLNVSLPQNLLFVLESQAEWKMKKGIADFDEIPNFLASIATSPLKDIRADRVGIVK